MDFRVSNMVMPDAALSSTGRAEQSRRASIRDRVFALDWRSLAEQRVLGDVLRLFSYRRAWLNDQDPSAYSELVRASRAANPNIRKVAELLLSEMALEKS